MFIDVQIQDDEQNKNKNLEWIGLQAGVVSVILDRGDNNKANV